LENFKQLYSTLGSFKQINSNLGNIQLLHDICIHLETFGQIPTTPIIFG